MRPLIITLTLIGTVVADQAQAASVDFCLVEGPSVGTFELYVQVSQGDNFGLAGYEFFFNDIDTIENLSPRNAFDPSAVSATGFTLLTSADNDPNLVAVQNSTQADSLIYGFGQTAGAFGPGTVNPIPASGTWDAMLLLARGTYSGNPADIVGDGPGIVNLWATNNGSASAFHPDDINLNSHYGCYPPEPSSVVLLLIGTATLFGSRRRRSRNSEYGLRNVSNRSQGIRSVEQMRRILLTLALLAVFGSSAIADTVFFEVEGEYDSNTFELYVTVFGRSSSGLAGYEFFFDDIDTLENLSPRNLFDPDAGSPTGFSLFVSPDDEPHLVAVQNSTRHASIIYGFGQRAGEFGTGTVLPVPASADWDARLLLATGTYSGDRCDIVGDGPGLVNLWATDYGAATVPPDTIQFHNFLCNPPEPTSVVLLLIGTATLFGSRRRRP